MLAIFLIAFGVFSRFIIHTPNFTPIAAIALFSGLYLNRKYAFLLPIAILMISDIFLGWHSTIPFTWGSMILITALGLMTRQQKTVLNLFGSSFVSAVLFFVITNFGCWLLWYPHTTEGFLSCYTLASPFFRQTLVSTLVYSAILIGIYEIIAYRVKETRLASVLLTK